MSTPLPATTKSKEFEIDGTMNPDSYSNTKTPDNQINNKIQTIKPSASSVSTVFDENADDPQVCFRQSKPLFCLSTTESSPHKHESKQTPYMIPTGSNGSSTNESLPEASSNKATRAENIAVTGSSMEISFKENNDAWLVVRVKRLTWGEI